MILYAIWMGFHSKKFKTHCGAIHTSYTHTEKRTYVQHMYYAADNDNNIIYLFAYFVVYAVCMHLYSYIVVSIFR